MIRQQTLNGAMLSSVHYIYCQLNINKQVTD